MPLLKNIVQFFVADKLKADKELFRKGAFTAAGALIILIFAIIGLVYGMYIIPSPEFIGIGTAFLVLLIGSIFVFKLTGSFTFMALFIGAISYLGLTISSLETGGIYSPDLVNLISIPVFALMISNRKIAAFWAILILLTFIALYFLEETGVTNLKYRLNTLTPFYFFQGILLVSMILLFLVFRNETLRLQLLGEVQKSHDEISNKNKEITDSITYAKRIQKALMSNERSIQKTMDRLKKS